MRNQSVRLYIYSSIAILGLALFWGVKTVSQQGELAEQAVRSSVEQEISLLTSAVRSSTQAIKFRLLDVLKSEGTERSTRAFQQSPFVAAALLEWDSSNWKMLWHTGKSKADFRAEDVKMWTKEWPLAQIAPDQVYFVKVGDLQGASYFAVIVPVRKPNNLPMFGVGVFPAAQFGLNFSAERTREIRVFDHQGYALALSHPAYLGASLRRERIVDEALTGEDVNTRVEWKNESGEPKLALATRMTDSNLFVSVETSRTFAAGWKLRSWLFLAIAALGAIALNYTLLLQLHKPLLEQLQIAEAAATQYKKLLNDRPSETSAPVASGLKTVELPDVDFMENAKGEEGPIPMVTSSAPAVPSTTLGKIVQSSLRTLDQKIKDYGIKIQMTGLEQIELKMDVLQLQTAIEEVIKNGVEAMQYSDIKWLNIDGQVQDEQIILKIVDTGGGIPTENLSKVFDPFFSTKDSEGVARGLGLNVVRRVIEEFDGTVNLESHQGATENGTTVTLQWPINAREKSDKVVEAPPVSPAIPSQSQDELADWLKDDDNEKDEVQFKPALIRKPKVRTLS